MLKGLNIPPLERFSTRHWLGRKYMLLVHSSKLRGINPYYLFILRKNETQIVTRLFLLGVGARIGIDRFYEGDVTGRFFTFLGFLAVLIKVVGLLVLIITFIYKTFCLLREFEDAEDKIKNLLLAKNKFALNLLRRHSSFALQID